jgi:integration host factor subunit beta
MTKSELIDLIAKEYEHIQRSEAEAVVNEVFEAIIAAMAAGERVELRGFGSFTTKMRRARVGRNPKTGDSVAVPPKSTPHFKPGKEMRERVDHQA